MEIKCDSKFLYIDDEIICIDRIITIEREYESRSIPNTTEEEEIFKVKFYLTNSNYIGFTFNTERARDNMLNEVATLIHKQFSTNN